MCNPDRIEEEMSRSTKCGLIAAALAILAVSPVQAQEARPKWYAELGYTQFYFSSYESNPPDPRYAYSSGAMAGTAGYQLHPNLAIEGLAGLGISKGAIRARREGIPLDVGLIHGEVRRGFGVFVKPSVAINERIEFFGRLGWLYAEHRVSYPTLNMADDFKNESVAYGVGAQFNLSSTSYVQTSWMNYLKRSRFLDPFVLYRTRIYGLNVSYGIRF